MADINQVISLGIGTPASVPKFLTFGMGIGAAVTVATPMLLEQEDVFLPGPDADDVFLPGPDKDDAI